MSENTNNAQGEEFVLGVYEKEEPPKTFKEKLSNFFYHYTWHSIIALFVIIAIVVCSVQMCRKTEFDVYVMYAGGADITMTVSESTGQSDYTNLMNAIGKYALDYDENGTKTVNLQNLFLPSESLIKEIEADPEREVNYRLISENTEIFKNNIYMGEYYVCLIAEHLYLEWAEKEANPFVKIAPYAPAENSFEFAGEYGIYLRSTPLYEEAGFSLLDEDTVICLRAYSDVSLIFGDKENREVYAASEQLIRALLAAK
jgi:hypothetical protein